MTDLAGKRILIVKLRYIGDTLSVLPVVDNLKAKVPGAIVDLMVNRGTEEIVAYHPGIRRVLAYDRVLAKQGLPGMIAYHIRFIRELRSGNYDIVIDFTHGDRAAFLCFASGASRRIT
ncbi:MAG: putative lipopolysaccharide heptosyltransferase III, partial [Deltaproteobacteria bacterium]|nr:putative lipopolysaccharide heptosyltransferase III [Deltaproteobacteria bacterium]